MEATSILSAPATAYSTTTLPFAQMGAFKEVFLQYIDGDERLASLLGPRPTLAELDRLAGLSHYPAERREVLVQTLRAQYEAIGADAASHLNKLAQADCFTVTTGHQLCVYLGPLYTVLKALTVVRLAAQMEERYPNRKVVPIFWLAGEDHDLEEIADVTIQGQKYHWQPPYPGPAGQETTVGLREMLEPLWPRLPLYLQRYGTFPTLAQAQAWLLHTLFGEWGLVVLDPADAALKPFFAPIIKKELMQRFVQPAVEAATARLEAAGHKPQIAVREVNLFLLGEHARERIILEPNGGFSAGSLGRFTLEEMLRMADKEPERFSPNVAMRPLYQEVLLPNLAYIGGPAEVAYWLQLKDVFEAADVPMPAVWPRAHAMILSAKEAAKLEEMGLSPSDTGMDLTLLKKKVVAEKGTDKPDTEELMGLFNTFFTKLETLTLEQDRSLGQAMAAERARLEKQVEPGIKRLEKAYERRFETLTGQAEKLQAKLAPGGGLQERVENYLGFEMADPKFIRNLYEVIDATRHEFLIVTQNHLT